MRETLGITGFWIRAVTIWVAIAVATIGIGMLMIDAPSTFAFSCGYLVKVQLVSVAVAAMAAPFVLNVYTRRLRDFGQGPRIVWALAAATSLLFVLSILAMLGCRPSAAWPGIDLPIYAQILQQLATWLEGLVSLGWLALTLYAGLRASKAAAA